MHKLRRYRAWNISLIVTGRKEENMHSNWQAMWWNLWIFSDYSCFSGKQDSRAEKEEGKEALVTSGENMKQ